MATPPVIILGMHRSGTSLLTKLLESQGLFAGYSKESNQESRFFLSLNQWIMSETNAAWDNPYCFQFLNDYLRNRIIEFLNSVLKSQDRLNFLGPDMVKQFADIRDINIPWGWKDPRNTFTIDVWGRIFPGVKVIHICRNPVDVAVSLRVREEQRKKTIDRIIASDGFEALLGRGLKIQTSVRVEFLSEGIKLWLEYIDKALSLEKRYGNNYIQLRFEDLLEHPREKLKEISDFAGLKVNTPVIDTAIELLNPGRKYAFLADKDLVCLYKQIKDNPLLHKLGYSDIVTQ